MTIPLIAKVTLDQKLEIPAEILSQLQPLTEYEIIVNDEEITLKKRPKRKIDDLRRRIDELGEDPEQPTLAEIVKIVKEVRQEMWEQKNAGNS